MASGLSQITACYTFAQYGTVFKRKGTLSKLTEKFERRLAALKALE